MDELETLKREVAVIARVLEEAGIEFNRNDDGRIIGVMMSAEAVVVGTSEMGT